MRFCCGNGLFFEYFENQDFGFNIESFLDFPFPNSLVLLRSDLKWSPPLGRPDIPHLRVDWEIEHFFVESRKGWINRKHHFLRFDDETLEISEFLWSAQNRKINRSNRSYPSSETYLFRAHLNCNITAKRNNSHFNLKSPFSPSKTINEEARNYSKLTLKPIKNAHFRFFTLFWDVSLFDIIDSIQKIIISFDSLLVTR